MPVDFLAFAPDGRPVTDLKAGEVTLKLDGRERPLRSVQYIELSGGEPLDRGAVIPKSLPLPFASTCLRTPDAS